MSLIKCPKCQAEIEADSFFCDQCGAELFVCPLCGTFGKGKRCTRCGEPLVSAKDRNGAAAGTAQPNPGQASGNQMPLGPQSQGSPVGAAQPANPSPSPSTGTPSPSTGAPSPTPSAQNPYASSSPNPVSSGSSITSDLDKVFNGVGGGTPAGGNVGATIRPGSPQPSQPAASQRQIPGHLVCNNPPLRLMVTDIIIGRREGGYASVFATQGMVSGRHAQIRRTPSGTWEVMDLGSTNGTRLNGIQLAPNVPTPFWVGDTLSFANLDFQALL